MITKIAFLSLVFLSQATTTLPEQINTTDRAINYEKAHISLCSNLIHTNYDRFKQVSCDLEQTNTYIMNIKKPY